MHNVQLIKKNEEYKAKLETDNVLKTQQVHVHINTKCTINFKDTFTCTVEHTCTVFPTKF